MSVLETVGPLELPGISTEPAAINAGRRARGPNRLWIVDFSQIWGGTSWLYFAFVLDCNTRRCQGWAPHRVPHPELITDALFQARAELGMAEGGDLRGPRFVPEALSLIPIVFGRGCYTAELDFPRWAIPSAADAALSEAFVASMRRDLVDEQEAVDRVWASMPEARRAVAVWIREIYNPDCLNRRRLERIGEPSGEAAR